MRKVNKAYDLPNSPSWHAQTAEDIKKVVIKLRQVFVPRKQEPTRVS